MKQHPLSAVFPSLPVEEMTALIADIAANGLRSPIVMFEGMVLDGWNRYLACKEAKVMIREIEYRGTDPVGFVKSANWHRRHLSASQRASAAVALAAWLPSGVKASSAAAADHQSAAQIAKEAGTGTRTVEQAKKVHTNGSESLKEAVREGEISVEKAAEIAKRPKAEQAKALKEAKQPKTKTPRIEKPAAAAPETVSLTEYQALSAKYDELVAELETCESIRNGDQAKEMNKLRASLAQANRTRDELMQKNAEMRKQIDYLNRELKKLGWKSKK